MLTRAENGGQSHFEPEVIEWSITYNSQQMIRSSQNQTWLDARPDLSEDEKHNKTRCECAYFGDEDQEVTEDKK